MNAFELEVKLIAYQEAYYAGHPEISDSEYDALCDELRKMLPTSVVLTRIGRDTANGKVKHLCPMGSQNKASTHAEFREWAAKHAGPFLAQFKLDGCSLELQYLAGEFEKAVTRGDGTEGEDVSANARKMKGFVQTLASRVDAAVRAECIMTHADFARHAKDKANCRNAAAGIMKRADTVGSENLTIVPYDVTVLDSEDLRIEPIHIREETEKLTWLMRNGFFPIYSVGPFTEETITDILTLRDELQEGGRKGIGFDIDGIVVKCIPVDRDDEALARPERQIAFKFEAEDAVTGLADILWSQSGRRVTPVASIEPVRLAGVTVTNATLHNMNRFEELALAIGDKILVSRRGDVIPHVEKLVAPADMETRYVLFPPKSCPTCGRILERDGAFLICPAEDCPAVVSHRILKWFNTLGIKGIGPAIAEKLGAVYGSIPAVYRATEVSLRDDCALGPVEAANLYEAIHSKREISLAKFIAGFDIEDVGESTIQALVTAGYRSLEAILGAEVEQLLAIPGIGPATVNALATGIDANLADMYAMTEENHIRIIAEVTEGALLGEVIVFTGALNTLSREKAFDLARGAGAMTKDSITKATTILVTNDTSSGSTKNKKAAAMGIKIVNEETFLAMCNGRQ